MIIPIVTLVAPDSSVGRALDWESITRRYCSLFRIAHSFYVILNGTDISHMDVVKRLIIKERFSRRSKTLNLRCCSFFFSIILKFVVSVRLRDSKSSVSSSGDVTNCRMFHPHTIKVLLRVS